MSFIFSWPTFTPGFYDDAKEMLSTVSLVLLVCSELLSCMITGTQQRGEAAAHR